MRRLLRALALASLLAALVAPALAVAAPRSGGSFSGRAGFRSSSGSYSRSYSSGRAPVYSGGGSRVVVVPGFGWGFHPFGGYGGGSGLMGTLLMVGLLAFGAVMVSRVARRLRGQGGPARSWMEADDDGPAASPDRAFVYQVQLGLGRSARDVQKRFESLAAEGDTSSEAGLAQLLQQAALELLRHKDSIRFGAAQPSGPFSLTNGEAKLNSLALAERARFQVERVRGADGKVRRSDAAATTSAEVLEYLVVTVLLATRRPLGLKSLTDLTELDAVLAELGAVPPDGLLGMEVIWTPADPEDALTEAEMLLTYPHLRGL
jgi:uncharacterized membrane protein